MTRRRWTWRGRLLLLGLAALVAGGAYSWHAADGRRLDTFRAQLDRDEPGWRLTDRRAVFEATLPPDNRNPMLAVQAVAAGCTGSEFSQAGADPEHRWMSSSPDDFCYRPRPDEEAELVCMHDDLQSTIASARRLADAGPGGCRYAYAADIARTLVVGPESVPTVVHLLRADALLTALAGDPEQAVRSVRTVLAVGRATGRDPFMPAWRYRENAARTAAEATGRVLALCEPTAGLGELQADLLAEAEFPRLRESVHAERAVVEALYDGFRTGRDTLPDFLSRCGVGPVRFQWVLVLLFRLRRDGDHRAFLEGSTQLLRLTDLPEHERLARAADLPPDSEVRTEFAYVLRFRHMAQRAKDVIARDLTTVAHLRTAAVGVACERFRRKTGRWPNELTELGDIMPVVPPDPFTGRPLLYRRVADGWIVYAVGRDGTDDGGILDPSRYFSMHIGADIGFRLFDPDHRNLPPAEDAP